MSNFTDTRDNTTAIEATMIAADADAEIREGGATWSECECEDCQADAESDVDTAAADGWDFLDGYDPAAEMYADHIAEFYGG
jgi:hypothetical protein